MSTDIKKSWFSAAELALLGEARVIDIPRSERRSGEAARNLNWPNRKVPGKGGRGGMKTEYQPPEFWLTCIHDFLTENPKFFEEKKKEEFYEMPLPDSTINSAPIHEQHEHRLYDDPIDPLLMHRVMVAVDTMLSKNKMSISPGKKADLVFLIHDYCKSTRVVTEEIVDRFLKLAG